MKAKLLISLSILMLLAASAAAQETKLTGDEIIAKHLEAVGGKELLTKYKTRIAFGTVKKENEPEGQMVIMSEAPNRLSAYYSFTGFDFRMVYTGESAFVRPVMPRQYSALTDKYEDMLGSGLLLNSIPLYNLLATSAPGELKFEAKGTKKVAGRQAYAVQVKPRKGSAMKLYFDAENFMWVRTDYGRTTISKQMGSFTNAIENQAGNDLTVDFYIETSDFRDVDGIKLPFKFVQVFTSPFLRQSAVVNVTGTIREYQHNVQIDPKMFQQ
ncbi:MAG TPA: hypothetical protein VGV59_21135 [Pyrinomonadaceae bacterium]|nr:hypothetical protein [Pyrinomonadaceae bacterium]